MRVMASVLAALVLLLAMGMGAQAAVDAGVYDENLLVNWTDAAFREAYGVSAADFVPSDPQPLTYIVTCEPVIDPRTGRESETSWAYLHRTETASTENVLQAASDLSDFSLTLTDDPNRATFRAVINYKYYRDGNFIFRQRDAVIPKYAATLTVTLKNMVTGESAKANRDCWAFPESSIETSVLTEGIGRQFFAGPKPLKSTEITAFNDLLGLGLDALYDYEDDGDGVCITKYLGDDVKTLELPGAIHGRPVTGLGQGALSDGYFTAVVLPPTLRHIDAKAFESCWYLTSIRFPDSLTAIGENAFNNSGLREVEVPDTVTELGEGAFSFCADLKKVRLPAGMTEIPASLLLGCGIASIEIPDTVVKIGKSAFESTKLRSVSIPESVREIGESAFEFCKALTEVTCAGEIDLVDHSAFGKCDNLSAVHFQKGVKAVGEYAFNYCPKLKRMDLTGAVSLGGSAFRWDPALTSVVLPETLTEIGTDPFGEHRKDDVTYAIPKKLVLTVVEGSYAHTWAQEQDIPFEAVAPPTEEELMARRYPPLKRGDRGEGVKRLQQALIDLGYLDDTADGSYGPKTADAVSAAQQAFGMEADGIASALFQARLYDDQ